MVIFHSYVKLPEGNCTFALHKLKKQLMPVPFVSGATPGQKCSAQSMNNGQLLQLSTGPLRSICWAPADLPKHWRLQNFISALAINFDVRLCHLEHFSMASAAALRERTTTWNPAAAQLSIQVCCLKGAAQTLLHPSDKRL